MAGESWNSGDAAAWVSRKGRTRHVRVVTTMKVDASRVLVVITSGIPGEPGRALVIPAHCLSRP